MQPLNAIVKNGRLTLDEPTDLPDGRVVVLLPFEEVLSFVSEEFGDKDSAEDVTYYVPAPRAFRRSKPVDARSLIDELRAM
jgi:hypothetical protein